MDIFEELLNRLKNNAGTRELYDRVVDKTIVTFHEWVEESFWNIVNPSETVICGVCNHAFRRSKRNWFPCPKCFTTGTKFVTGDKLYVNNGSIKPNSETQKD